MSAPAGPIESALSMARGLAAHLGCCIDPDSSLGREVQNLSGVLAGIPEESFGWLVVIIREQTPEVFRFDDEARARAFEDQAGQQWLESFVCKIVKGPKV